MDQLIKSLAFEDQFRIYVVDATETVSEAQKRHETWNTATAALGRTIVGTALLGATLKGTEKVTVRIDGDGPAGHIVADGNGQGEVKGYIANPKVSLPLTENGKIDVKGAVGTTGNFMVTKDLGMKEPFSGQVPLVSGEIGEDFTYYMATSEQTPSAIGLSVLINQDETVRKAGGFMIQVLPGADEETIGKLEETLASMPMMSQLMDAGKTPEDILESITGKGNARILETMPISFTCSCSKERFGNAIASLGYEEIQEMIEQDHGAEAVCHFCGEKHYFSEEELKAIQSEPTV